MDTLSPVFNAFEHIREAFTKPPYVANDLSPGISLVLLVLYDSNPHISALTSKRKLKYIQSGTISLSIKKAFSFPQKCTCHIFEEVLYRKVR